MQFLNNDMDQLLQKAAEGYDVPVAGADFDKVALQLDETQKVVSKNSNLNGRRFLLLLCFLLTSLVCNKYLQVKFGKADRLVQSAMMPAVDAVSENGNEPKSKEEIVAQSRPGLQEKIADKKNLSNHFYNSTDNKSIIHNSTRKLNNNEDILQIADAAFEEPGIAPALSYNRNFIRNAIEGKPDLSKMALKEPAFKTESETANRSGKENKTKWLYLGVAAGLDISTVNFKQAKTGFYGGVLVGYELNKRWAFETGLLWNKKSYYAEGKDFNTKRLNLPGHTTIIHAEGYCQMFEIPLQVRYQFQGSQQGNWFAAVGASSYLMQKEDYDYLYERYNVQYYSSKYYKASTQNWLATLNLSAGYQKQVGQHVKLRIEPYVKLPVNGMGIGELPITSMGLQVGLTLPVR